MFLFVVLFFLCCVLFRLCFVLSFELMYGLFSDQFLFFHKRADLSPQPMAVSRSSSCCRCLWIRWWQSLRTKWVCIHAHIFTSCTIYARVNAPSACKRRYLYCIATSVCLFVTKGRKQAITLTLLSPTMATLDRRCCRNPMLARCGKLVQKKRSYGRC